MIGRKRELEVLMQALDGLHDRTMRGVEIAGDPGVGKTLLLTEFARGAGIRGQVVLASRACEQQHHRPLGMVMSAVDDHTGRLGNSPQRWVGSGLADVLSRVFPTLVGPATQPWPEPRRAALFREVRVLFEELAEPDGLVLIFDDVHWADETSARLIAHLLEDPPRGPVLMAVAHRPRQLPPFLRAALAGAGRLASLELGPLSEREAHELLGPCLSRTQRRTLYQASGGVPFYLEGLAAGRDEPSGLSTTAAAAVRAELAGLSPQQLLVAQAAAVVDDQFGPPLVAELVQLPLPEVREIFASLTRRDLIRETEPAGFSYRHPLVRQVVYETTGVAWRLAAHARAASVLGDGENSVVTRARHVELVANVGDEQAAATLVEAASRMVSRAPAEAANWLRSALRLLPDSAEVSWRQVDLMTAFAKALAAGGRLQESGDTLHEVVRRLPHDQKVRRVHAVAMWAMMQRLLGRHRKARALLLKELEGFPAGGVPETAALKLELVAAALLGEVGVAEQEQLKELVTAVDSHPDPVLRAAGLALVALVGSVIGRFEQSETTLSRAARMVDDLSDDQLARRIDTVIWVGWGEIFNDRYIRAKRHLNRGLNLARSSGSASGLPRLLVALARLHMTLGWLPEAAELVDEALELAELSGSDDLRTMALTVQCQLAAASGDLDTALRAGGQATETGRWVKGRWWTFAWLALAEARLLAGDAKGCLEAIELVGGGPELPGVVAAARPEVFEMLTRAELAVGRPERAEMWADRAEAAAERGAASGKAFALLAQSRTLVELVPGLAAERATTAASAFARLGRHIDAGRARLMAGLAYTAAGQQVQAENELDRAEVLFEQAQARSLLEQARQERSRLLEHTPRSRGAAARLGLLTKRETQVATLVSEGYTNRQIAQRLGVTDKTVEAHLARVFAKLGVASRAAVAVLVVQTVEAV
ncbi:AAA family ATPase [Planomonospora sp. ID67723]|uniref:helix-turn-helix transcriptional regulator n=1 Tax=Planomonospora sp. ID67723 TaxID=2738134 RepID=UPI0018C39886|nr:AAA family ATPase [Planomonospora sp. ID67723]MBG0831308.1 AAA family ATPase [Planomonospora sp. ID67723]